MITVTGFNRLTSNMFKRPYTKPSGTLVFGVPSCSRRLADGRSADLAVNGLGKRIDELHDAGIFVRRSALLDPLLQLAHEHLGTLETFREHTVA